ncbi:YjbH domain-containing protein [Alteromonas sp. KUL49]|uniref:YjbH domain-containing protein n=1 Tax=Alteromonas sp. KUL49 TaxID=2480798 RepID=UPI0010FFB40D|nr:YjbH domain-containing protein [Alteromonas sp. KUL49]GEA13572.1 membrane protein [Alteromonas sp. KUL49]
MRVNTVLFQGLIVASVCGSSITAFADDSVKVKPTQMVQGGVGLIQTPTARMWEEGGFAANYTDNGEYRFWSVNLQLFDWMQATARYTDVRTRLYSDVPSFSGDQTLKDKGLDVKFRLWKESYYLPDVSVGFRDFGGTGFFESEYVNMSKAVGPFDFHLGLGWGYMGRSDDFTNPFCEVKESFCTRPTGFSGRGGKIDYNEFFKGPVAIFGGVEYQTPWEPLTIKLEYEGNDYSEDRAGPLGQDTRFNIGAVYKWRDFDFSLNYQRGNTIGFGVTYQFNMNTIDQLKIKPPPRDLSQRDAPATIADVNKSRLYNDIHNRARFVLLDADLQEDKATFYGRQLAFRDTNEAAERVGRIIASEVPDSVETYHLIEVGVGGTLLETKIDAEGFIEAARNENLDSEVSDFITRENPSEEVSEAFEPSTESGFSINTNAFWTQTFGNPEEFYMYQAGLLVSSGYAFNRNFSVMGSARITLFDNFDKFTFLVDQDTSTLPRVRTRVREYVSENQIGLDTAFVSYQDKLSDNIFAQAYGGYLETMYAGIGGEVLYREVDSRIAYGFDLAYVKQRDPYNQFSFLDYDAITGHASVYWQPEFLPDTQLSISAGQFLAEDRGVNIDFAKRFDSGIVVGAFAAFTNVSSEEYGEGSFTKGFYISIPMDLFVLKPSKGRGLFPWVPISRDGGQLLRRPIKLMDLTESRAPFYN